MDTEERLQKVLHKRVVFFTGAGLSAESGIPTYRGKGGTWEKYNFEDYACQDAFVRRPRKVWEFHDKRREFIANCPPNRGHELIANLEQRAESVVVITQNIDGLHDLAGSTAVHELHGSIWRLTCRHCGVVEENREVPLTSHHCDCGRWFRPDIVWFGDSLREDVISAAEEAIAGCDLLFSIGTSGVVYPAAQLPFAAKSRGALLVEINIDDTPVSDLFDVRLRGKASEELAKLYG